MNRLELLKEFVILKHGDQVRKYTGEPYHHLFQVSEIAASTKIHLTAEVGLCHDLFEDTDCTPDELSKHLLSIGYDHNDARTIVTCTWELKDEYTPEDYPQYPRKTRKNLESDRMKSISPLSQTVKYADIINNSSSIEAHAPGFYRVYRKELYSYLKNMNRGYLPLKFMALKSLGYYH